VNRVYILVAVFMTMSCESERRSPLGPILRNSDPSLMNVFFQTGLPSTVAPGESVRIRVFARYSDGSEKDVTADASWTSTQAAIATVEAGVVTGGQTVGRVSILASYEGRTVAARLVTQPSGTFVLDGTVTEPGPFILAEATVAIVGGSHRVMSSGSGFYEMFGVSGTVAVRASKQGYLDETRTLTVTEDQRLDLLLRPVIPPASIGGTYRMTVTIGPSCDVIPDEYRTRIYTAAIEQTGPRLRIVLSDANFTGTGAALKNAVDGTVRGSTVSLQWGSYNYYYYSTSAGTLEILPGGQVLGITGVIEVQAGQTMSGDFLGWFALRESNRLNSCHAPGTIVMRRI
jgi:hypothetical protein